MRWHSFTGHPGIGRTITVHVGWNPDLNSFTAYATSRDGRLLWTEGDSRSRLPTLLELRVALFTHHVSFGIHVADALLADQGLAGLARSR